MEKARSISKDGIIGYNIMTALRNYADHVKAAVKAKADLIISGAGLPVDLPALVENSAVKIAPIVSTARSAQVILRYWDRKYRRTADLIVAEGPLAGGHLGFTEAELLRWETEPYDTEFQNICSVVKQYEEKYDCKIPVIAAGGIYDRKDVEKMERLGADGVQVATRFVTTRECDADIRYKEAYIHACKEDISIVKSPVGMPGRAILNPLMKRVMLGEKIEHSSCHRCLAKCNPSQIPYCITDSLIQAVKGDIEHGLLFCGANAWKAEKIETVEEVVASLFA